MLKRCKHLAHESLQRVDGPNVGATDGAHAVCPVDLTSRSFLTRLQVPDRYLVNVIVQDLEGGARLRAWRRTALSPEPGQDWSCKSSCHVRDKLEINTEFPIRFAAFSKNKVVTLINLSGTLGLLLTGRKSWKKFKRTARRWFNIRHTLQNLCEVKEYLYRIKVIRYKGGDNWTLSTTYPIRVRKNSVRQVMVARLLPDPFHNGQRVVRWG